MVLLHGMGSVRCALAAGAVLASPAVARAEPPPPTATVATSDAPSFWEERNSPALVVSGLVVGTVGLANVVPGIALLAMTDPDIHGMGLHALHGKHKAVGAALTIAGGTLVAAAIPLVVIGGRRRETGATAIVLGPASLALRGAL